MSQAEFAAKAGVHRNTQVRYESGQRYPAVSYLKKIKELGVDTGYLDFGRKSDANSLYDVAAAWFLPKVMDRVGLSTVAVLHLLHLTALGEVSLFGPGKYRGDIDDELDLLVDALFEDGDLLANVFEKVESVEVALNIELSYRKKAPAVAMLYRAFKASGKVDPAMIEEAVKLAAS